MSENPNPQSQNYGANNIQALEGLEAVRKRPACTLEVQIPRLTPPGLGSS